MTQTNFSIQPNVNNSSAVLAVQPSEIGYEIKSYTHPQFGDIRVAEFKDGQILFCLSDLAKALGYANPAKAVIDHCKKGVTILETPSVKGLQPTKFGKEGNIYRLTLSSKLPDAEKFQDWVCDDLLPTIRRTGSYSLNQPNRIPTNKELALMVIKAEEEKERLMLENKEQQEIIAQKNAQIEVLDEKSKYVDYVLRSPNTIKMSIIAQDYGMSAKAMNSLLRDYGIQYSQGGVWLLKAKYKQCGYVHGNPFQVEHKNSNIVEVKEHTVWTQKGRLFIYNFLKEKGVLPLLERKED